MPFKICKLTDHAVVDFAAAELKKYLRMMMPECGDIAISRASALCEDAFVLGKDFLFGFVGIVLPGLTQVHKPYLKF